MTAAILAIIGALLPIAAAILKWWLDTRPQRLDAARRKENAEISDMVDRGDSAAVSDWLHRQQAEHN